MLPIRAAIAIINGTRTLLKSKALDKFVYEFRTKIQNDFDKAINKSYLTRSASHSNTKLVYVDIGARDGLPKIVSNNKTSFGKIILCEGEPEEAKKLSGQGYLVIDKFLADKKGDAKF